MSTKPYVARPVPLLFRNSIAGAVARAIEYHAGYDLEHAFAVAAVFSADRMQRVRVESYAKACGAGKADATRMRHCATAAHYGVKPADRGGLLL